VGVMLQADEGQAYDDEEILNRRGEGGRNHIVE